MAKRSKVEVLRRALDDPDTYPDRELARLARLFRVAEFEPGDVLMREGQLGGEAYLIADGVVRVHRKGTDLAQLGPGEFVGELALLEDAPRTATVTAVDGVRVLVADRERFTKLVSDPGLRRYMDRKVRQRRKREAAGSSAGSRTDDAAQPLVAALEAARAKRQRRRRRSTLGVTAGVLAFLLVAGVAIRTLAGRSTPVTVEDAVERFRNAEADGSSVAGATGAGSQVADTGPVAGQQHTSDAAARPAGAPLTGTVEAYAQDGSLPAPADAALPAPGVYQYDTAGFEEVNILGGSRHEYPARTTVTLTRSDCGVDVRWDALEERWDRWRTCADGKAIGLRDLLTYHEFFNQADQKHYVCTETTQFRPATDQPGTTFTGRCQSEDALAELTGRVVGIEEMSVNGQAVKAVHVRLDETLTGSTKGTRASDSWYELDNGLLLKRVSRTEADAKAVFGHTHYIEEFQITLADLTPQR